MTKDTLKEYFSMDEDLINNYHVMSGKGLETCTDDTWAIIEDLELHQKDYGYFGIDKSSSMNSLVGFFIKPEHRNTETVLKFWEDVENETNGSFLVGVHTKNKPAVTFLQKKCKILQQTDTNSIFYFIKERG